MAENLTMTLSGPDGNGGTTTSPPFTSGDLRRVADSLSSGKVPPPMKETDADREVSTKQYRITVGELRSFVERMERLNEEKKIVSDQQKEVMAEAKARGYDTKALRKLIALRTKDPQQVAEEEAVLQLYREALEC
ncbi:Uncharacterized conserved protein, UPF0335 family [Monaibacterium marinum]|uniref:Uncharacterized conserved protein, UPF0335 family n=1 Tax=Pontivivens marinum TaxID=1690039 RepID=A0A2C9CPP5_9RHOB|nr:Uncharacterized conserved protein, UPF0335 family [Monaibacterium marinum]